MGLTIDMNFGALLMGALIACSLSGTVLVQSVLYFMLYPKDAKVKKVIVSVIWSLDTFHTCLIMAAMWDYFILHFGEADGIDHIPWTLATTVAVTAILTSIVHCFLVQRIHTLLKNNWRVSIPIIILTTLRLVAATVTTGAMIKLDSFTRYTNDFGWLLTTGLSLSSAIDCVITFTLCYHLRSNRRGTKNTNRMIDSLVLYTFETGALTSIAAILTMIFWLAMPYNRIFLALHFVISKLYANSLLATLNMRVVLVRASNAVHVDQSLFVLPSRVSFSSRSRSDRPSRQSLTIADKGLGKLEINIERIIERRVEASSDI